MSVIAALLTGGDRVVARRLRYLAVLLATFALLFTAAPRAALAAGNVVVGSGSGINGTVSLADAGSAQITVVAYLLTDGEEDWYDYVIVPSGEFTFPELAPGRYVLRYSSGGYREQCFGGATCTPVDVVAGQAAVLDEVTLERFSPGTVKGRVVGGDGQPLAGVTVRASYDTQTRDLLTDAAGVWALDDAASEVQWHLRFTMAGRGTHDTFVYPEEGRTIDNGVVMLQRPGTVAGTVRNNGGAGVADAGVHLALVSGGSSYDTLTGADGSYSFGDVVPGRYWIRVDASDHPGAYYPGVAGSEDATVVSVTEDRAVTGADVMLITGATIAGTIQDSNGPLSGFVTLHEQGSGLSSFGSSDAEGAFSFTGLWPGKYTVEAEATHRVSTWLGGAANDDDATWVSLASGVQSLNNDITLASRPAIPAGGQVLDADGNPVAQLTVMLDGQFEALTDEDGRFSITVDHTGTYAVAVMAGASLVCGGDAAGCPTAQVEVPPGGTPGLVVTVPDLGSLVGAITLPDGVGIEWGQLDLMDASGNVVAGYDFSGETDYYLAGIPYGAYRMAVEVEGSLAPFTAQVTIDGAVNRDIDLSTGHSIAGEITVPQNENGVRVVAIDAASGEEMASEWVETPGAGQVAYHLDQLNAGGYKVGVQADGGGWTWYPMGTDPTSASVLTVTIADAAVTGIDLVVPAVTNLVRVTGTLRLPDGIPASRAASLEVWFESDATNSDYSPVVHADGSYQVDLPKGGYRVHIDSSSDLGTAPLTEDLQVTGPLTHNLDLALGGSLTGRLVDAEGLGVPGRVWVTSGGSTLGSVEPNSWGFWTIGTLASGTVDLHTSGAGFVTPSVRKVTVVAGQVTDTGVQQLAGAGRLAVRIPEFGDDVKVNVVVTDSSGRKLTSKGVWSGDSTERIDGIPAGQVKVRFEAAKITTEWWRDAAGVAEATAVTVKAGETSGTLVPRLSLAAPPADGTISGLVTNSTGRDGVLLVKVSGSAETEVVAVSANGTWSAKVQPGKYQVKATLCAGYWMGESECMGERVTSWYPGVGAAYAQWVTVTSGQTTGDLEVDLGGPPAFRTAAKPTISGQPLVGATLTAAAGNWAPVPDSLAYQWLRGGVVVAGATGTTYAVTGDDLDQAITVKVTGTKDGYRNAQRTSAATAKVIAGQITPGAVTITGSAAVGATLTAVPGTWAPAAADLAYRWLRNGQAIDGATAASYAVVAADAGAKLSVRVTGTKAGYNTADATSAQVSVPVLVFTLTPVPTISGTAKLGATLTAVPGAWGPGTARFTYQWLRDGVEIGGATGQTHAVNGGDFAKALSVKVTGSQAGYASVSKVSAPTAKVPSSTMKTVVPTISGTLRVGGQLTARTTGWVPGDATFTYKWFRSGKTIKNATASTYTLTASDLGKTIKVAVAGMGTGYPSASATSKSTKKVGKGTIVTAVPRITDTAKVGQKVTVQPGTWQPTGTRLGYQWYRSGKVIKGAKSSSYTPGGYDRGKKLTVKVTGSKTAYSTASKTSVATAAVAPGDLVPGTPTITGSGKVGKVLTAKPGTWKPSGVSFTYQWLRNGVAISRGTSGTYKLVAADLGAKIAVTVTGKKAGYNTVAATSAETAAVAAA